jgi:hypothetical protein
MSEMKTEAYAHDLSSHSPCVLCGEYYQQKGGAVMLYTLHDGEWFPVGDVCPVCVAADPEGAAIRMREYAELLRTRAGELVATAHRVDGITEWATIDDLRRAKRGARGNLSL